MRPLVMGVLNVTPDSFADGGRYLDPEKALVRGLEMVAEGADIVDVGGESSRPGAEPVAEAAVAAGATLVNDISASLWSVAAAHRVGWVAMHMRGVPATMQDRPRYGDVVGEVRSFLLERAREATEAGVAEVWIDPGIGFGKTAAHNLELLRHLPELVAGGFPVLVGTSRKSFLGHLAPTPDGSPSPVEDRLPGSLATATWAMAAGAAMVRVHDVAATVAAATLVGEPVVVAS